ncbi:DUF4391 domain-containing protein [Thermoanaerobacterium thermosaccharolyticum]|uniref:DUF4391 domain-containing protein n=1 Tax=Thermoanaerobacterium thermosaccharolyticum TaxID=1517 RepID=UPI003DAA45CB
MLGVPEKYKVGKKFDAKIFLNSDLTPKEKKKFRDAVQEVVLEYQIAGEEIPSIINDEYNCQVILCFDVKLKMLKDSSFVGEIMQKVIKPLAVIRFWNEKGECIYCLAYKRLNMQDKEQIVIEDTVYSPPISMYLPDERGRLIDEYIGYEKIINRANKLTFYYEMFAKMVIIANLNIWARGLEALNSKVYYNIDESMRVVKLLKKIKQLEFNLKIVATMSEKARINGEIKSCIDTLNSFIK